MQLIILFAMITVISVILLFSWLSKTKKKQNNSNVIPLHKKRGATEGTLQLCSRCKKRLPLTFYASDTGTVRGLCKECAREAGKREELYPV